MNLQVLLDVGLACDRSLGSLGSREQLLCLDVFLFGIRAGRAVSGYPLDFLLEIGIRRTVRMPQIGDVAVAQLAAVSSGTGEVGDAAGIPVGGRGGSGHALTAIIADLFLIGLAGNVCGFAVDAAVIARVVVEQDIRKGQGLTARRRTEDSRCWNLSCVNVTVDVDRS